MRVSKKRGGGAIEEWWLRDQTGLSHGSFCAARKELVAAGLLVLGKDIRKTTYEVRELTGKTGAEDAVTGQKEERAMLTSQPCDGDFFFASPMPHVAGTFFDFDEWTDALMNALGECLDISESLVEEGTYTVYSHDFESEDTYHTETTSEGFIVN